MELVDRMYIEEIIRLHHTESHNLESARQKKKGHTKEPVAPGLGGRHGKNEQNFERTGMEGKRQSWLKNSAQ